MKPKPYIVEQVFNDLPISFRADGWVNATQMAKPFGKEAYEFLRLPATKEFIEALIESELGFFNTGKIPVLKPAREMESLAISTGKGRFGGTWLHPLLGLEFARWLSPRFAIWTNRIILEILAGKPVTPDAARKLWDRHTPLELLGWCQDVMAEASTGGLRVKEIRGNATEIREALIKRGRECPPANWLGKWLMDLKHTRGEEVAEFSRGHARREWVIRARPS